MDLGLPRVYFVQLAEPLNNGKRDAFYYIGSAKNIQARFDHYREASKIHRNAFLTEAKRRQISFKLVYVIPMPSLEAARELEAKLKRQKKSAIKLMRGGVPIPE